MPASEGHAPWSERFTAFQRLCVLRCLRPDKLLLGVSGFVGQTLGAKYLEPPPFNLKAAFDDSRADIPLTFVLPVTNVSRSHFRTF